MEGIILACVVAVLIFTLIVEHLMTLVADLCVFLAVIVDQRQKGFILDKLPDLAETVRSVFAARVHFF